MKSKARPGTPRTPHARSHPRAGRSRLSVHRTGQHIYAQLFAVEAARPLLSLDRQKIEGLEGTSNVEAAKRVGALIAERAQPA